MILSKLVQNSTYFYNNLSLLQNKALDKKFHQNKLKIWALRTKLTKTFNKL